MSHSSIQELISFEEKIKFQFELGKLPFLLHLCGGNEEQLVEIFKDIKDVDWVFSTHRSHYHYLLKSGNDKKLEDFIKNGNSMFVFDRGANFFTSSILAGTCSIAAGIAYDIKRRGGSEHVWCFIGDGAEEEGHFYESVLFVDGHNLPCTFIIEDNDRSVDVSKNDRRGDGQIEWPSCVRRYHYTPTYPHAGTGCKHWVEFDQDIVQKYSK
jgi:TPP-dependent pyruvate/acetoin dehydrogenase alpha subunit